MPPTKKKIQPLNQKLKLFHIVEKIYDSDYGHLSEFKVTQVDRLKLIHEADLIEKKLRDRSVDSKLRHLLMLFIPTNTPRILGRAASNAPA